MTANGSYINYMFMVIDRVKELVHNGRMMEGVSAANSWMTCLLLKKYHETLHINKFKVLSLFAISANF